MVSRAANNVSLARQERLSLEVILSVGRLGEKVGWLSVGQEAWHARSLKG